MSDLFNQIRAIGGEGILKPDDLPKLRGARLAVFDLMKDGGWHTREQIDCAGGCEGTRRMRELRMWFTIDRRRRDGPLQGFEYRMEVTK